jgi:hypothetical protein
MKKIITTVLALTILSLLSGCSTLATTKAMVSKPSINNKHNYSVHVNSYGGESATQVKFGSAGVTNKNFKKAIEESIINSELFSSVIPNNADYILDVTIFDLSRPGHGFGLTVDMETAWSLTNKINKKTVFRKSIQSSYTTGAFDAFAFTERLALAVENAAKKNIEQGLKEISKLNLK